MPHISEFPHAILHIDGDAFFASCEQARNPLLAGKPVVTGKERGIAASMSYEAKARGVTRAMPLWQIKKLIPDVVILPSDYETYSLLSKRLYAIVRRYTPDVEEYGVDECFADITGMRRVLKNSYHAIAKQIQHDLLSELGFTFSIGLAPTKVLAKVASNRNKPHGLVVIRTSHIPQYLDKMPTEKVWGIGPQTAAYLARHRIMTALEFADQSEAWITSHLTKPHIEIWHELNGRSVMPLITQEKTDYQSVQKFKTFTPPSTDAAFIVAQLSRNMENACAKLRRYHLAATRFAVILRTQDFRHAAAETRLVRASALPQEIFPLVMELFHKLFRPGTQYRATGITLFGIEPENYAQPDLFGTVQASMQTRRVYDAVDTINRKYGKYTLGQASSLLAHQFAQHEGARGDAPTRKDNLFRGENGRQRLAVPMWDIPLT